MRIPPLSARRRARIEIIPLIDVVFFLLATFMMVSLSMVQNRGVAVHLPVAATGVSQTDESSVTITVAQNGELYLEKERVALSQLPALLEKRRAADPNLQVFIQGDERASFGRAIRVLDEVRRTGITKATIRAKRLPGEAS